MGQTYETPFVLDDGETEVVVTFEWTPGTPETGRYNCPPEDYDPGSAPELYITKVRALPDRSQDGSEAVAMSDAERERFHDENAHVDWEEADRAAGEEYLADMSREDAMWERWS